MTAVVLRGDAAALPLPDGAVDLIVTSPPYFGLRSYSDGGQHYSGQVGDEATPAEYLDALVACTAEWVRVLKPGGSIFVNLGDKYAGGGGFAPDAPSNVTRRSDTAHQEGAFTVSPSLKTRLKGGGVSPKDAGVRGKSLIGLPWRYAIRCVDQLGLILRAEIIWAKPNGLPESVTDRVRRSHEQVFHFVKQPRYYSAVDEVREPSTSASPEHDARRRDRTDARMVLAHSDRRGTLNALGKLPGSVWTIPTAPLQVPEHLGVDHFAAFPPELVKRIVAGWSPREVCSACGEGRRPVADRMSLLTQVTNNTDYRGASRTGSGGADRGRRRVEVTVAGYACACQDTNAPATPGLVLDPFCGTGTTMLVASVLGRVGIGVEMSADYCRLARWRTSDPGERARALGVPKPPPQVEGQLGLFEGLGA